MLLPRAGRNRNECKQSSLGTATRILTGRIRWLWETRPYVFTEDVPNHWLTLHSAPSYPHGLHQLGVGDDEILPIDEEDWELLFAQHIGCSNRSNEHLAITFRAVMDLQDAFFFLYWSALKTTTCQTLRKFWHLELGWDLLCNLTLKSFLREDQ